MRFLNVTRPITVEKGPVTVVMRSRSLPSWRSIAAAVLVAITYFALGWWMGSLYS